MQKRLQTKTPSQSQVAHVDSLRSRPMEEPVTTDVAPPSATESAAKVKHHFGNIPVQAKLTIGAPDDQYEQEADRVADQVMSTPAATNPVQRQAEDDELQMKPLASRITPLVQRETEPEEDELQTKRIQREAMPEEDELQAKPIQREMESEEEEPIQTKPIQREMESEAEEPIQTKPIQREAMPEEEETLQTKSTERSGQATAGPPDLETRLSQSQGGGSPLQKDTQQFMESRFGTDFSHVKIHTGSEAVQMNREIGAQAFTHGSNVYFGAGKYDPGSDSGRHLLAHELTHVVQQTGAAQRKLIQRVIDPTYDVTHGQFQVNANPQNAPAGSTAASLPISIRFEPKTTAPYSNQIGLIQIVRDINSDTGANVEPVSLPAARAPRLRTQTTDGTGVEAGFFTDALHNDEPAQPGAGTDFPEGQALPPQYPFGNDAAQPNPATPGLSRPFSSGGGGATVGYKRSDDPADIKAAELTDAPGSSGNRNFDFETVAKGEDTMTVFGALKWGFQIRAGRIQNEHASVQDAQSATFDAALERHRDFYVHEPVIFYFDFDSATLSSTEADKIDTFLDYLRRPGNANVKVTPTGFADRRGGRSAYNRDLSLRRARAVDAALRAKGVAAAQINAIASQDATEEFTPDATTNQDNEANRRGNRRVVLTFERPAGGGGAAGGAGGTP